MMMVSQRLMRYWFNFSFRVILFNFHSINLHNYSMECMKINYEHVHKLIGEHTSKLEWKKNDRYECMGSHYKKNPFNSSANLRERILISRMLKTVIS